MKYDDIEVNKILMGRKGLVDPNFHNDIIAKYAIDNIEKMENKIFNIIKKYEPDIYRIIKSIDLDNRNLKESELKKLDEYMKVYIVKPKVNHPHSVWVITFEEDKSNILKDIQAEIHILNGGHDVNFRKKNKKVYKYSDEFIIGGIK